MRDVYVNLPDAAAVQTFVSGLTKLGGDFEFVDGRYILDARSLMGIFSLDLAKPLTLRVYNDSPQNMAALAPFMVDGPAKGGQTCAKTDKVEENG